MNPARQMVDTYSRKPLEVAAAIAAVARAHALPADVIAVLEGSV